MSGDGPEPASADSMDAALARARADARRRGTPATGRGRAQSPSRRRARPIEQDLSGPGPDDRDPQLLGATAQAVVEERGWEPDLKAGAVSGRWAELVGTDIAEHCRPERLVGGELVVVAESTAWATQLRLLAPGMVRALTERLGPGLVDRIVVHGPSGPSWRKGLWRVAGRGPRDTYG